MNPLKLVTEPLRNTLLLVRLTVDVLIDMIDELT